MCFPGGHTNVFAFCVLHGPAAPSAQERRALGGQCSSLLAQAPSAWPCCCSGLSGEVRWKVACSLLGFLFQWDVQCFLHKRLVPASGELPSTLPALGGSLGLSDRGLCPCCSVVRQHQDPNSNIKQEDGLHQFQCLPSCRERTTLFIFSDVSSGIFLSWLFNSGFYPRTLLQLLQGLSLIHI